MRPPGKASRRGRGRRWVDRVFRLLAETLKGRKEEACAGMAWGNRRGGGNLQRAYLAELCVYERASAGRPSGRRSVALARDQPVCAFTASIVARREILGLRGSSKGWARAHSGSWQRLAAAPGGGGSPASWRGRPTNPLCGFTRKSKKESSNFQTRLKRLWNCNFASPQRLYVLERTRLLDASLRACLAALAPLPVRASFTRCAVPRPLP